MDFSGSFPSPQSVFSLVSDIHWSLPIVVFSSFWHEYCLPRSTLIFHFRIWGFFHTGDFSFTLIVRKFFRSETSKLFCKQEPSYNHNLNFVQMGNCIISAGGMEAHWACIVIHMACALQYFTTYLFFLVISNS